ncbi:MAG: response regulator transcription factor [Coriobacteriaceae bacterium]|nr:response regulator transcription factor [Coriobacteriaceae bacterium]
MDARILIVEDDQDINAIAAAHLTRLGYTCVQAFSGTEAALHLEDHRARCPFDLVLCDLMLPGLSGEQLVADLRARGDDVPVVVVSARTACADRVSLLKMGADDYVCKPFDLDELAARVDVQLRRRCARRLEQGTSVHARTIASDGVYVFGRWRLNPMEHTFCVDGLPFDLTPIEFALVSALMAQPGRAFSKRDLFEAAWGEPYAADDNTVTAHISNIRAKLKATQTDSYIKTVWGMGFKLQEPSAL